MQSEGQTGVRQVPVMSQLTQESGFPASLLPYPLAHDACGPASGSEGSLKTELPTGPIALGVQTLPLPAR